MRELDGLAETAHGEVDESPFALLGGVEEVHEEGCKDVDECMRVSSSIGPTERRTCL